MPDVVPAPFRRPAVARSTTTYLAATLCVSMDMARSIRAIRPRLKPAAKAQPVPPPQKRLVAPPYRAIFPWPYLPGAGKRRRVGRPSPLGFTPLMVMGAVAQAWGVQMADLLGRRRCRGVAIPRQAAMALAVAQCSHLSIAEIGRQIGRDHTTVLNAMRRHTSRMQDGPYAERAEAALSTLLGDGVNA